MYLIRLCIFVHKHRFANIRRILVNERYQAIQVEVDYGLWFLNAKKAVFSF